MKFIFSVRDRAIDAFMQPFFAPATGAATRSFVDEVNRADSPMNQHPEDYDLYLLGTFDDSTGEFSTHAPRMVAIGKDSVRTP